MCAVLTSIFQLSCHWKCTCIFKKLGVNVGLGNYETKTWNSILSCKSIDIL